MCFSLKKENEITHEHIFQRLRYLSSCFRGIAHTPKLTNLASDDILTLANARTHSVASHRLTNVSNLNPSSQKKHHAFIILSPEDLFPPSHFIPLSYPSIKRTAESDQKRMGFYMLMSCYTNVSHLSAQYVI